MASLTRTQLMVLVSALLCLAAVMVPEFFKRLEMSRLSEPKKGLHDIASRSMLLAATSALQEAFPESVERTPESVPHGEAVEDAPEVWEKPTLQKLAFGFERPHRYAFSFESEIHGEKALFTGHAWGDLDGDGELSHFWLRGMMKRDAEPQIGPLVMEDELE